MDAGGGDMGVIPDAEVSAQYMYPVGMRGCCSLYLGSSCGVVAVAIACLAVWDVRDVRAGDACVHCTCAVLCCAVMYPACSACEARDGASMTEYFPCCVPVCSPARCDFAVILL